MRYIHKWFYVIANCLDNSNYNMLEEKSFNIDLTTQLSTKALVMRVP